MLENPRKVIDLSILFIAYFFELSKQVNNFSALADQSQTAVTLSHPGDSEKSSVAESYFLDSV